jgi:hypothetical protein
MSVLRRLACLALLAVSGPVRAGEAPAAADLLFDTPYLSRLAPGTKLAYDFSRQDSNPALFGPAFEDKIELTLAPDADDNTRTAVVSYFTGERHRAAGPFREMTGNPIVMLFLEQDVLTMSHVLHGNPRYLRNRLRTELSEGARIEPQRFRFAGRDVEGWKISLRPFAADPNRDKLLEFAEKRYEFLVGDAVPGGIYEIRTVTPRADGTGPALLEERLSLAGVR